MAKTKTAKKGKRKVSSSSGIMKKLSLSDAMTEFMGASKASRAEIVQEIWKHIKKYKLNKGRDIFPDKTLQPILGRSQIKMFDIAKKISAHVE